MPTDTELPAGRELDARVAAALGYAVQGDRGVFYYLDQNGEVIGTSLRGNMRWWSPSQEIAHAWDVVEQMRRRGWHMRLVDLETDGWDCNLFGPEDGFAVCSAPTASHAICLAALDALEGNDGR